jgi:hypothetical protein
MKPANQRQVLSKVNTVIAQRLNFLCSGFKEDEVILDRIDRAIKAINGEKYNDLLLRKLAFGHGNFKYLFSIYLRGEVADSEALENLPKLNNILFVLEFDKDNELYFAIRGFCKLSEDERKEIMDYCNPLVQTKLNKIIHAYEAEGVDFIEMVSEVISAINNNDLKNVFLVEFCKTDNTRDLVDESIMKKFKEIHGVIAPKVPKIPFFPRLEPSKAADVDQAFLQPSTVVLGVYEKKHQLRRVKIFSKYGQNFFRDLFFIYLNLMNFPNLTSG